MGSGLKKLVMERLNNPAWRGEKKRTGSVEALCAERESSEEPSAEVKRVFDVCNKYRHPKDSVYFLECGEFIKIGFTTQEVEVRLSSIATGSPYEYTLLLDIPGGIMLERALHKVFSEHRHKGEWFRKHALLEDFLEAAKWHEFVRPKRNLNPINPLKELSDDLEKFNMLAGETLVYG